MAMPEIVEAGELTAGDLMKLMERRGVTPADWKELPAHEAALHLRGRICPDSLLEELDWHIREIEHVNANRHFVLRWPVVGRLLRDQHEINRLILISLEKSVGLSETIEAEFGRLFSRFRKEDRAVWIKRFRYLGRRWNEVTASIRELREAWEDGRMRGFRLRSRAGQDVMNPLIEEALRSLSEIASTLVEIVEGEVLKNEYALEGDRQSPVTAKPLDEHVESSLWHAAEGRAVRVKLEKRPIMSRIKDGQKRLNRIYMIALEEDSTILQELAHRIAQVGCGIGAGETEPVR